jgi:uncharacterized membrane protein YgdD (TMEM256/DUF423 family)
MNKILAFVSLLGAIGIALGAFGAHRLKEILSPERMDSFETAVRYQLFHVLIVLVVGCSTYFSKKIKKTIVWVFIPGIILFSGSIYGIILEWIPIKYMWFLTPLGGVFLIIGWLQLAFQILKTPKLRN